MNTLLLFGTKVVVLEAILFPMFITRCSNNETRSQFDCTEDREEF